MTWKEQIRARLVDPGVHRWLIAGGGAAILHVLALSLLPPNRSLENDIRAPERRVEPIYLDITPAVRPARLPPEQAVAVPSDHARSPPPIVIRPRQPAEAATTVAPLVVDTPPPDLRPQGPGRVIPQSWRRRCGLGEGEVSEADWQACRDGFLQAATPTSPPVRRRGDPAQDFAAQGAARIAAYEARRAPAPTGSGNARPSATPGSNFGMGEIDASVVYGVGERPVVNGGID